MVHFEASVDQRYIDQNYSFLSGSAPCPLSSGTFIYNVPHSLPLLSSFSILFFLQSTEDVSSQWTERQAGNWTAVYHSYTGRTSANCSRESGKSEKESAHQAGCVTEGPSSICSLLGAMGHYGSTDVSTRAKTGLGNLMRDFWHWSLHFMV